jgi:hypothetical protein
VCALAVAVGGCGSAHERAPAPHAAAALAPSTAPAFGLTEDNAALLWSPAIGDPRATGLAGVPAPERRRIVAARQMLTALHPRFVRLLVNWAALQPDPARPADLEGPVGGCARRVGPCPPYAGIREQLAAIASQQRVLGSGFFQPVIVVFGTPSWAAQPPSGCEGAHAGPGSRAPSQAGLLAYRALIRRLIALGAREGVALDWWSAWNEPNDPAFLAPQRSSCGPGAASASPNVAARAYAQLARAMAGELAAAGGARHLLLGELNAYEGDASDWTTLARFVAALPGDVLCLSRYWAIHAYAARAPYAPHADPVKALEAALDARGGCARAAHILVTEAGAGAPHPGSPRPPGAADQTAGCMALARQLAAWSADPRLEAVLQYSFREDQAFPVGLVGAELARVYPAYSLWLAWSRAGAADGARAAGRACKSP